jgi:hypothetical protein
LVSITGLFDTRLSGFSSAAGKSEIFFLPQSGQKKETYAGLIFVSSLQVSYKWRGTQLAGLAQPASTQAVKGL